MAAPMCGTGEADGARSPRVWAGCPEMGLEVAETRDLYEREAGHAGDWTRSGVQRDRLVNETTRAIVVEWQLSVGARELYDGGTVALGVRLVDEYLAKHDTPLSCLHILSAAALSVAAGVENEQNKVSDAALCFYAGRFFTERELAKQAGALVAGLGYVLRIPRAIDFLRRYNSTLALSPTTWSLCQYAAELALLDAQLLAVRQSLVAAAALYLAVRLTSGTLLSLSSSSPAPTLSAKQTGWNDELVKVTGYAEADVSVCAAAIAGALARILSQRGIFPAVPEKFSSTMFDSVALRFGPDAFTAVATAAHSTAESAPDS